LFCRSRSGVIGTKGSLMNVVVLQGTLSSDPAARTLASGSVLVSLELTTVVDGASVSVPVAWFDPPIEVVFAAGEALLVVGTVRRRFFRTGGLTQSRTEVVAAEVLPVGRRRQVRAALARAVASVQADAA
jgi:single-strand DNA-binding protein